MSTNKDKTSKVLFKDMVQACIFRNVGNVMLMLYPDQRRNINAYKSVFETLKQMRPRYNKEGMVIDTYG